MAMGYLVARESSQVLAQLEKITIVPYQYARLCWFDVLCPVRKLNYSLCSAHQKNPFSTNKVSSR